MKAILKEILIMLLLCVAIILILGVIFYNYMPFKKVIPSKVEAYVTPNNIKNEINEEIVEYPKENVTFEITDSDLTLYKQSQSYSPGKSNPFADYTAATGNSVDNTSTGGSTTSGSSTATTQNKEQTTEKNSAQIIDDTKLK